MIGNKNSNGIAVFGNPLFIIADKLEFSGKRMRGLCPLHPRPLFRKVGPNILRE